MLSISINASQPWKCLIWPCFPILWVDEIRSHHFETLQNHCLSAFAGESSFQASHPQYCLSPLDFPKPVSKNDTQEGKAGEGPGTKDSEAPSSPHSATRLGRLQNQRTGAKSTANICEPLLQDFPNGKSPVYTGRFLSWEPSNSTSPTRDSAAQFGPSKG